MAMNDWHGERVVQLLPTEGWGILFDADGVPEVAPMVGWALLASGQTVPVEADQEVGVLMDPRECSNFVGLLAPGTDMSEVWAEYCRRKEARDA